MASNAAAFEQLAGLRRRLKEIGTGLRSAPAVAAKQAILRESLLLVRRGFLGEMDPWDRPWKPLQDQRAQHSILVDTRRMMSAWKGHVIIKGITLTNRTPYVIYHQHGTFKIPVRSMVPDPDGPLPPRWAKVWNRVAMEALERYAHW